MFQLTLRVSDGVYEYATSHTQLRLTFRLHEGRVLCRTIGKGSVAVHVD